MGDLSPSLLGRIDAVRRIIHAPGWFGEAGPPGFIGSANEVDYVSDRSTECNIRQRSTASDVVAAIIVCGVAVTLYLKLPRLGDIAWYDASGHALNGAFVLDFLRAMPLRHPMDFAIGYYRQWPALTIGFYPPVFYVSLAASYAIFGVSEAAALIPELAFLALLGWGAYHLSRHWLDPAPALAVALLLMGAPGVSSWGQQIMLDVPAYALLILAIDYQLCFMKRGSQRSLYAATSCAVLAIATKYNAAFIVGVMGVAVLYARGWRFALSRTALRAAALGVILMLPVLAIFLKFSMYNVEQSTAAHGFARFSFEGLTYYARILGAVISWPTLALAAIYCAALPFARALRLPRVDAVFLLVWVIFGYVFYAMIAIKEPRHILFITYPFVLAAVLFLDWMLRGLAWRSVAPLTLACGVFAFSLVRHPAPYISGMRQAAQDLVRLAPEETNIAFWGNFCQAFIYAMRAYNDRMDLGVVRLDKLLLRDVAITLDWGFTEEDLSEEQIVEQLRNLHVQYVVIQTHYYEDRISVIHRLSNALQSDKFREVERIAITTNDPTSRIGELVLYRAVAEVAQGRIAPPIRVKILNRTF
jgi:hypothetical protein